MVDIFSVPSAEEKEKSSPYEWRRQAMPIVLNVTMFSFSFLKHVPHSKRILIAPRTFFSDCSAVTWLFLLTFLPSDRCCFFSFSIFSLNYR